MSCWKRNSAGASVPMGRGERKGGRGDKGECKACGADLKAKIIQASGVWVCQVVDYESSIDVSL